MTIMLTNTTNPAISTTLPPPLETGALIINYVLLCACCVFSSVAFAPIKHFETGDGFYFQFIFAIGMWVAGLPMLFIRNFPDFYTIPLLGGVLWSVSNLCTVPVIGLVGIGIGSLFWNTFALVWGWAHVRYGWYTFKI
jgi:hypothetical protein